MLQQDRVVADHLEAVPLSGRAEEQLAGTEDGLFAFDLELAVSLEHGEHLRGVLMAVEEHVLPGLQQHDARADLWRDDEVADVFAVIED